MLDAVNILLVDDQPARLLSYDAILASLGHRLVHARSGEEGLQRLMEMEFAAILLDINMPGMDGFETAALIHQHPRFEKTPIIFVTAVHVTDLDRLKGYTLGAVDYVYVPVVPAPADFFRIAGTPLNAAPGVDQLPDGVTDWVEPVSHGGPLMLSIDATPDAAAWTPLIVVASLPRLAVKSPGGTSAFAAHFVTGPSPAGAASTLNQTVVAEQTITAGSTTGRAGAIQAFTNANITGAGAAFRAHVVDAQLSITGGSGIGIHTGVISLASATGPFTAAGTLQGVQGGVIIPTSSTAGVYNGVAGVMNSSTLISNVTCSAVRGDLRITSAGAAVAAARAGYFSSQFGVNGAVVSAVGQGSLSQAIVNGPGFTSTVTDLDGSESWLLMTGAPAGAVTNLTGLRITQTTQSGTPTTAVTNRRALWVYPPSATFPVGAAVDRAIAVDDPATSHFVGKMSVGTSAAPSGANVLRVQGSAENTTGAWAIISDQRVKQDIERWAIDARQAGDRIRELNTQLRTFCLRGAGSRRQVGVIAQELEQSALADWVTSGPGEYTADGETILLEDLRTVDPGELQWLLVRTVAALVETVGGL